MQVFCLASAQKEQCSPISLGCRQSCAASWAQPERLFDAKTPWLSPWHQANPSLSPFRSQTWEQWPADPGELWSAINQGLGLSLTVTPEKQTQELSPAFVFHSVHWCSDGYLWTSPWLRAWQGRGWKLSSLVMLHIHACLLLAWELSLL